MTDTIQAYEALAVAAEYINAAWQRHSIGEQIPPPSLALVNAVNEVLYRRAPKNPDGSVAKHLITRGK